MSLGESSEIMVSAGSWIFTLGTLATAVLAIARQRLARLQRTAIKTGPPSPARPEDERRTGKQ